MHILLLEDLPEIRQWLKALVLQVFPAVRVSESARVHDALEQITALRFDLALIDLGLPDGSGVEVVAALRESQPDAQAVVVTIHDDDDHLFPALQAGAFGYLLKEQPKEQLAEQLQRITQGEPPLSPSIARRVIAYFASQARNQPQQAEPLLPAVQLTERENEVLLRVAKGFTLPEIGVQLGLSRHTIADYVKQIYRKLNVSSRAEAALEAQRLGLFKRNSR
ncbi:response regulator [Caldimonas aquatica]|uniref:Response regulator transcription factor n=2 Tax=Pseudomonadota TaxID=1224 RepID=A0ABY6MRC5_9BURK|nr:response regulator transcription factor [Schlegelella aquatica]UZD54561.1 response regulator transcription factor [Schlegelella aquatica]